MTGYASISARGSLRPRPPARGPPARARAPGLRAGVPEHVLGPRPRRRRRRWATAGAYGAWLRERGFAGDRVGRRPRARDRAARGAADAVPGNHDAADAPEALAVLDDRARGRAGRRARRRAAHRRLEPAGDGPDAACALALAIVFAARADGSFARLKACPHAHCGWAFYDPRATAPASGARCASAATAPRARRSAAAAPRSREPDRTAGNRRRARVTVTPRSRPSAGPPATLSHDAMAARRQSPLASAATRALGVRPRHLQRHRVALNDGAATTLHVATYDLRRTVPRVVRLPAPTPLERWCREHGVAEAIVGGFFVRPAGTPLGELRTSGIARPARAVRRAVGRRARLPARRRRPRGARAARRAARRARRATCCRPARCSCAAARPASTATSRASRPGRGSSTPTSPRAATRARRSALAPRGRLLAVACDGRADDEAGLTLGELAETLVALGARTALNLDGGGSTSLVCGGPAAQRPARGPRRRAGGRATGLDRDRVHASVTTSGTTGGCACSPP